MSDRPPVAHALGMAFAYIVMACLVILVVAGTVRGVRWLL